MAVDLVNLGFAQIYLSLMIDGVGSQPFSAQTLPPLQRPPVSCKGMVVEASRTNYANKRTEVEQVVIDLHATTPKEIAPNKSDQRKQNGASSSQPAQAQNGFKKPFSPRENNEVKPAINNNERPLAPKREVPPQKKAEDLRSILGKMSQSNQEQTKGEGNGKKSEEKVDSANRSDLKSALASVLMQTEPVATQSPVSAPISAPVPEKPKVEPTPIVRDPVKVPEKAPDHPVPPRRAVPAFGEPAPASQEASIDPAVVKRMLRDHQQEKSPFA